jgi:16S rRNA (adenine1518-N6/adenine1519-N6)-dimethyltransferase
VEIARFSPCEATGWEHVRLYLTRYQGNVRFPAAEVEAAAWFPLTEIEAWLAARPGDFASSFIECWKTARRSGALV